MPKDDGFKSFLHFGLINSSAERQTSSAPGDIERVTAQLPACRLVDLEDLQPVEPGSSLKTLRSLRQTRAAPDHFRTTSSLIGAAGAGRFPSGKSGDFKLTNMFCAIKAASRFGQD